MGKTQSLEDELVSGQLIQPRISLEARTIKEIKINKVKLAVAFSTLGSLYALALWTTGVPPGDPLGIVNAPYYLAQGFAMYKFFS